MDHYDSIVIGLGAAGAATLYQLARRGANVLGLDQFKPPHDLGSSHGQTRITRLAIGEGDAYVPLVRRSHEIWRELEAASGRDILTITSGLILAPRDRIAAHHGKADFVRKTMEVAGKHGIRHEVLDAAGIRRHFPQFKLRGDEIGYWERDSGFVRPEEAIGAQLDLAERDGGVVHTGEKVVAIEPRAGINEVITTRGRYRAEHVVVAAGPWVPAFLGDTLHSAWHTSVAAYRQVMHWYDTGAATPSFMPGSFPIFIWMFGDGEEDYIYGFPAAGPGNPALKVATERYADTTTPSTIQREVANAEIEAMLATVKDRLDAPAARHQDARACLYTVTPDRHFLVDSLPGLDGVHLVSACSGHGFKHSAAIGEAVAQRILGLPAHIDLAEFGHARLNAVPTTIAPAEHDAAR